MMMKVMMLIQKTMASMMQAHLKLMEKILMMMNHLDLKIRAET
jgi:hypothetical protein